MRVFSLDLLPGRTAQRWGVPGHAAGLLNNPKALWPHLCPPRQPAVQDCLQAGSCKVLLLEAAGWGSFPQPRLEPGHMEALSLGNERQQKTLSFVG